jgi:hypothetical protein
MIIANNNPTLLANLSETKSLHQATSKPRASKAFVIVGDEDENDDAGNGKGRKFGGRNFRERNRSGGKKKSSRNRFYEAQFRHERFRTNFILE